VFSIGGYVTPPAGSAPRRLPRQRRRREFAEPLRNVVLFRTQSDSSLRSIARLFTPIEVPAGRAVMHEGDLGREFAVLVNGAVGVESGSERVTQLQTGSCFGEVAMLPEISGTDHRIATVTTLTPARIAVCSRQEFRDMLHDHPEIGDDLVARAAALAAS
jgi:CRP-like cAMP-binding protein